MMFLRKEAKMKAVGIIGFKKSGKTTLGVRLAAELGQRGHKVGVIKHTAEGLDRPETDSVKYSRVSGFAAVSGPKGAEILLQGEHKLDDILDYFQGDLLLVEGFKEDKTFPKIVCLRNAEEKNELCNGLELGTASFEKGLADFDIMNDEHVRSMADLIVEKGFKLTQLDCKKCRFHTCAAMAKAIVAGQATLSECVSLNPSLSIKVDDKEFALNPFTANLCKQTIIGMLSSLKGYKKGKVTIEIP
jgi:molybdopterin-guanine dinucleotide biosynthesis protein B